jgi:hypothetical protein
MSMRDAVVFTLGVAGMWGVQVATQTKTQNAIENLGTKMEAFVEKETERDLELQRQIDELRKKADLAIVLANEAKTETARQEGMLTGSGILKTSKGQRDE